MDRHERRNTDVNDATIEVPGASHGTLNTPQGFEELYRNTFPRVYAYVASLLRDRSAAEDVTALAFERAFRKRNRFSARRGSLSACPMTTAFSSCVVGSSSVMTLDSTCS